ncbi:helix-turn-helix domain-containing protein [Pediococcus ethanolidurans]|uniref:helix-turn-helix domain-containing protein n=1 Tax=Pediococcus ethanolidurans TaxID=319653 RepID=UPI0029547D7C|nr:helix-turn-helix transcriptional regulator [Pediococcus ethanolidurans]
MTFADQLIKQRKRAGYTRSALAKELNVSLDQVTQWEHGDSEPNLAVLRHLHKLYEISMDELILNEAPNQSVSPSRWLAQIDKAFKYQIHK